MTARVYLRPADLIGEEGTRLEPTDWILVDQARVNGFADVTGDRQWIHVDVERARREPIGGTIAHGYLTLSLVNFFLPRMIEVRGFSHAINVGADRLRFLAPVKVGSRIRGTGEIVAVAQLEDSIRSTVRVAVEIEAIFEIA